MLKKYLIQDHRFLDAFVVLLASMVAGCRKLEDRIPGCQFLAVITGKENTYFERSFDKLGCDEERMSTPDNEVTKSFIQLMTSVAKGGSLGYVQYNNWIQFSFGGVSKIDSLLSVFVPHRREKLAVLCVCEWSYLSWADIKTVQSKDDMHVEWIDLHRGDYFAGVVEYLRGLLDVEGALCTESEREACKKRFLEAVALEEAFFDSAYE